MRYMKAMGCIMTGRGPLFFIAAVAGLIFPGDRHGRAEIWTELKGNAVEYAPYTCAPCCKVTNSHAARRIRVQLYLPLGKRAWVLEPMEAVILRTPRGECIRAGLGMEANFID